MRNLKVIFSLVLILIISVKCSEEIEPLQIEKPTITLSGSSNQPSNGKTEAGVYDPNGGTFYSGDIMNIKWSFLTCTRCFDWISEDIDIDLYKGNSLILRIASNVPFFDPSNYDWEIPSLTMTGSDFNIRITSTTNSSNWSKSSNFSLITPSTGCFYSHWKLTGIPTSGSSPSNSTVQYRIKEDGLGSYAKANAPVMRFYSGAPINIVYNGITYYSSGYTALDIPINSSTSCNGVNPVINAPLKFQKIGSSTTSVSVLIQSVSSGHYFYHGYHTIFIY